MKSAKDKQNEKKKLMETIGQPKHTNYSIHLKTPKGSRNSDFSVDRYISNKSTTPSRFTTLRTQTHTQDAKNLRNCDRDTSSSNIRDTSSSNMSSYLSKIYTESDYRKARNKLHAEILEID